MCKIIFLVQSLHIFCFIVSVGLYINNCIIKLHFKIRFYSKLPSKYISIVKSRSSTIFRGQNLEVWQNAKKWNIVLKSVIRVKKCKMCEKNLLIPAILTNKLLYEQGLLCFIGFYILLLKLPLYTPGTSHLHSLPALSAI